MRRTLDRMTVSRLLKSWAMPPVSWPTASIFCACRSWASTVRRAASDSRSRRAAALSASAPSASSSTAAAPSAPNSQRAAQRAPPPMVREKASSSVESSRARASISIRVASSRVPPSVPAATSAWMPRPDRLELLHQGVAGGPDPHRLHHEGRTVVAPQEDAHPADVVGVIAPLEEADPHLLPVRHGGQQLQPGLPVAPIDREVGLEGLVLQAVVAEDVAHQVVDRILLRLGPSSLAPDEGASGGQRLESEEGDEQQRGDDAEQHGAEQEDLTARGEHHGGSGQRGRTGPRRRRGQRRSPSVRHQEAMQVGARRRPAEGQLPRRPPRGGPG